MKILHNKIKDDIQILLLINLFDEDVDYYYETPKENFNSKVSLS
jgi:hypothetical protein